MEKDFAKVFNLKDLKDGEGLDNLLYYVYNGKIHEDVLKFDSVETLNIVRADMVPTIDKWLKVGTKASLSKGIVIGASAVLCGLYVTVTIMVKRWKKLKKLTNESKDI